MVVCSLTELAISTDRLVLAFPHRLRFAGNARRIFLVPAGNASFIGDDSVREKGQTIFEKEIKTYESKHPRLPPACEDN